MTTQLTPAQLAGRERFSIISRKSIEDEAVRDESNPSSETTLWKTINGSVTNLNYRYTVSTNPIILFEWDMHDFWHTCMQSAKTTDADDAGQDRLLVQILYAREMGTLSRNTEGEYEEAVTDGGRIWTDLPYLVPDLKTFWQQSMDMKPGHRRNLAAFTARLIALGVGGPELTSCVLWLLRETLEVPRTLVKSESGEEIAVSELLPACLQWFRYSSHKLLMLSAKDYNNSLEDELPGELAVKAGVEQSGFSIGRWLFWRNRFKELTKFGDEKLQDDGKLCFLMMIRRGRELGLDVPGEKEYDARVSRYLRDKRESMGPDFKGAIWSDGMSIYSDEE